MGGFLTEGLPGIAVFTGQEEVNADTQATAGSIPQSVKIALYKQALMLTTMMNTADRITVAGTVYFTQFNVGFTYTPVPQGSRISENSFQITGVNIPWGSLAGADVAKAYLYNSAGVCVAQSAQISIGAANTVQQIPFAGADGLQSGTAAPVTIQSGTYYIGLQALGAVSKFKAVNSPIWPYMAGSNTGSFGVPGTLSYGGNYAAGIGPMASLY